MASANSFPIFKRIIIPISILGVTFVNIDGMKDKIFSPNLGVRSLAALASSSPSEKSYFAKFPVSPMGEKIEFSDGEKDLLVYTVLTKPPVWDATGQPTNQDQKVYLLGVMPKNSSEQLIKQDVSTESSSLPFVEGYVSEPANIDKLKRQMESKNIQFSYNIKVIDPTVKEGDAKLWSTIIAAAGITSALCFFLSSFQNKKQNI
jgi:hypothetical protein